MCTWGKMGFIILSLFLLIACATTVSFNVEHPPLIDLRNVKTITVIPFEWDSSLRHENLSDNVTNALVFGIKLGDIAYIDSSVLKNVGEHLYFNYVDVYIKGRIVNIFYNDRFESRQESRHSDIITTTIITRTVTVDIEYSYIRAYNNEVLGYFNKSATDSASYYRTNRNMQFQGYNTHPQSQNMYHSMPNRQGRGGGSRGYRLPDSWTDNIAASAVTQFSYSMNQELGMWTSPEKRAIKGRHIGSAPGMTEARRLVGIRYYGRATDIYTQIFEDTGDIRAGYNLAVLLQLDEQYTKALELLKQIQLTLIQSGKRIPSFITKEIDQVTGFIESAKILEKY